MRSLRTFHLRGGLVFIMDDHDNFPNTDSLGGQPFKGASWALVLGLPLRDTITGLFLVLGPFLIPMLGLVS